MAKSEGPNLEGHVSGQANKPLTKPAHALPFDSVARELNSNTRDGLTAEEAKTRLEQYGRNELSGGGGVSPLKILIRQVANAMMLVRHSITISLLLPNGEAHPSSTGPDPRHGRQLRHPLLD